MTSVPPVTLLAFVAPAVATFVLPTTVVVPAVTLIVAVIVGGLGPTVWAPSGREDRSSPTLAAPQAGRPLVGTTQRYIILMMPSDCGGACVLLFCSRLAPNHPCFCRICGYWLQRGQLSIRESPEMRHSRLR